MTALMQFVTNARDKCEDAARTEKKILKARPNRDVKTDYDALRTEVTKQFEKTLAYLAK